MNKKLADRDVTSIIALPQETIWFCWEMSDPTNFVGPATIQNLVVKFDGEISGGVLVENASDDFPQQKKLENLLPNFAGGSLPTLPKASPTSLWKSLVLKVCKALHAGTPQQQS